MDERRMRLTRDVKYPGNQVLAYKGSVVTVLQFHGVVAEGELLAGNHQLVRLNCGRVVALPDQMLEVYEDPNSRRGTSHD